MKGWRTTTIDAACNIEYGTRVVQKRDGGSIYPVYGGGGATFFMDSSNRANRVVVSRFGMSELCTRYVSGEFFLNDSGLTLSPRDTNVLLPEFLDRIVLSLNDEIFALGKGAAQKNLDVPAFRGLRFAYPASLPEQRRIVAILDEAFEAIATAKANTGKNLQNAREWATGQLSAALVAASESGGSGALETLVASGCTLSYGIVQPGEDVPGGLPVVRPVDLGDRVVVADGLKRIDPALARSYTRTTLQGGDLLLCVRGTTGTVSIAEPALAGANVTRGIVPIRFDSQVITQELGYYLLRSEPVQAQIRAKTYGAALMQINIGDLRKIVVAFPLMQKQAALVEQLDAIQEAADRLSELSRRKLTALDELKRSLLHQAFTGQLTAKATNQQVEAVA